MAWNIPNVNLAGVPVRNTGGSGGYAEPTTGAYKVKITNSDVYTKEGGDSTSIRFQCVIADGDFAGTELRVYIGTDLTKVGLQRSWKTALLSAGMNGNLIENGNIGVLSADQFDGKMAYIYYKAKDVNAGIAYPSREFITPDAYAALHSETLAQRGSTNVATVTTTPVMNVAAAPQPGGSTKLRGMIQR